MSCSPCTADAPAALGCSWSGMRSCASSAQPPVPLDPLTKGPLQSRYSTFRCRLASRRAAALIMSMPCAAEGRLLGAISLTSISRRYTVSFNTINAWRDTRRCLLVSCGRQVSEDNAAEAAVPHDERQRPTLGWLVAHSCYAGWQAHRSIVIWPRHRLAAYPGADSPGEHGQQHQPRLRESRPQMSDNGRQPARIKCSLKGHACMTKSGVEDVPGSRNQATLGDLV